MTNTSMETILPNANRDLQSDYSVVWSTTQVQGLNNPPGSGRRLLGRRRLRMSSLAFGSLLVMHCQVPASALSGGLIIFLLFLVLAVSGLANPMRHFEIYLGQWSMSGPGRAFRYIPMLDGIGIAICVNALVRAVTCSTTAAIICMYLYHTINDVQLPFTYCRNFELRPYQPYLTKFTLGNVTSDRDRFLRIGLNSTTVQKITVDRRMLRRLWISRRMNSKILKTCRENLPHLTMLTPNYNFFYIELMDFKSEISFQTCNMKMVYCLIIVWTIIWALMLSEQLKYGRLIWNNLRPMFVYVPWMWVILLSAASIAQINLCAEMGYQVFNISPVDIISIICAAFEVALYIHASSCGTEIILGKGLNYYASGHIDPNLNEENVWHSIILTALAVAHLVGAGTCSLIDMDPRRKAEHYLKNCQLWILPLYSRCSLVGNHTHLVSTLLYSGFMLSYVTVAFVLVKAALHTVFEYRVKLVFIDKFVVALIALCCFGLSLPFTYNGGLLLLEHVTTVMTGVVMPFICFLQLVCFLYLYRSNDFISDMNISTEDNALASRIGIQWHIIPYICLVMFVVKIVELTKMTIPSTISYMSILPLAAVVIAVPLRTVHNAFIFLCPNTRT